MINFKKKKKFTWSFVLLCFVNKIVSFDIDYFHLILTIIIVNTLLNLSKIYYIHLILETLYYKLKLYNKYKKIKQNILFFLIKHNYNLFIIYFYIL